MKRCFTRLIVGVAALCMLTPTPAVGQTSAPTPYTPPRTRDGHADLQGVWQVLNTAAWDLEDHQARLGVPAGPGVVEGGAIPYQPSALAQKQENFAKRATLDPEASVTSRVFPASPTCRTRFRSCSRPTRFPSSASICIRFATSI